MAFVALMYMIVVSTAEVKKRRAFILSIVFPLGILSLPDGIIRGLIEVDGDASSKLVLHFIRLVIFAIQPVFICIFYIKFHWKYTINISIRKETVILSNIRISYPVLMWDGPQLESIKEPRSSFPVSSNASME